MKRSVIVFSCLLTVLALRAERYGFERYQAIVDRQMFGPVPEGFDPTRPPSEVQKSSGRTEKELTKEQEQVKKSVRFSMINLNPKGETMVGFTDNSDPKEARHYYLKVGESRDGWTVRAADAVAATVSISKDGVDLDLELGSGSGGAAPAGAAGQTGRLGATASGGLRRGGLLGGGGRLSGGAGSLRERRMAKLQQREANEKAAAEDQAKRAAEAEAEKAKEEEEKAQREAEREQQRQQLMQIQEELKKAREARQAAEAAENADNSSATDGE